MRNKPPMIVTGTTVTMLFEDGPADSYVGQKNFEPILEAIKDEDWDHAYDLTRPAKAFEAEYSNGRVSVSDGVVLLDGNTMHGALVDRMVDMYQEGFDIEPLSNFLVNLKLNPSKRAVDELYGFLEVSRLPITPDGYFLAYKRVRADFFDIYTGKMDNSVGKTVQMERNEVNDNKEQTCSQGLHFCAREYLSAYGTSRGNATMIVKINPRDVVSIPTDYNNAKGRCCKYLVVDELVHSEEEELELRGVDSRYGWDEPELPEDDDDGAGFMADELVLPLGEDDLIFKSRTKLRTFLKNAEGYKFWDRDGNDDGNRWIARKV